MTIGSDNKWESEYAKPFPPPEQCHSEIRMSGEVVRCELIKDHKSSHMSHTHRIGWTDRQAEESWRSARKPTSY